VLSSDGSGLPPGRSFQSSPTAGLETSHKLQRAGKGDGSDRPGARRVRTLGRRTKRSYATSLGSRRLVYEGAEMSVSVEASYLLTGKSIWVTGHRGMVGSAVVRALSKRRDCRILTAPRHEVDLMDLPAVRRWMDANRPDVVIVAAAKVGGILA